MKYTFIKVLYITSTIVFSSVSSVQGQSNNPSETPSPNSPLHLEPPQCLRCEIKYPKSARRKRVEGRVRVGVDVDKDGNVINVYLIESSGNLELDEAHIAQTRNWKFKPSANGRKNVQVIADYIIKRSLRERLREGRSILK